MINASQWLSTARKRWETHIRLLHHGEMVARDVGAMDIILPDHGIPQVRSVVGLALQQPLGMAVRVGIRPRIGGELAHPVLAPDGEGLGRLRGIDHAGTVGGECSYARLEVR